MIVCVYQIDLQVSDFSGTIQLFKTLGMRVLREMPERGSVEMALPGENQVVFEIHQANPGGFEGIHHIAFKSVDTDDIHALKESCGVNFITEGAVIQHTGRTVSTFQDRNGLNWQLTD